MNHQVTGIVSISVRRWPPDHLDTSIRRLFKKLLKHCFLNSDFKDFVGRRIVDFAHCRRHFGNDTKLVCFDGEEEGIENIAPDTLVRLG